MYTKRERKPKVWSDFETETDAHENQAKKMNVGERDENVIAENKSDKKITPVKNDPDSIKKVKNGSKVKDDMIIEAENDKDDNEIAEVMEDIATTENATKQTDQNGKAVKVLKADKKTVDDACEKIPVSVEEMKSIKAAVESKRSTKYIEKCDRVMERLDNSGNSLEKTGKFTPKFNKALEKNSVRIELSASEKKTPGKKRGRPKKIVMENNSESVEPDMRDIGNSIEMGFHDLDESGEGEPKFKKDIEKNIVKSDLPASEKKTPGKKRGRPKKSLIESNTVSAEYSIGDTGNSSEMGFDGIDESDEAEPKLKKDIEKNIVGTDLAASGLKVSGIEKLTPGKKRGRPKKSVIEDHSESVSQNIRDIGNTSEMGLDSIDGSGDLGPQFTKDADKNIVRTNLVASGLKLSGVEKITPGKKRGRPKKSVIESNSESVEHSIGDLGNSSAIGFGSLDESGDLGPQFTKDVENNIAQTDVEASDLKVNDFEKKTPGKKRGRPKKSVIKDNCESIEGNVKEIGNSVEMGFDSFDVSDEVEPKFDVNTLRTVLSTPASEKKTPGKKRGRPKKSVIADNSESGEQNFTGLGNSTEMEFDNLDESARLLSTPVSAPVRKRGKRKMVEEADEYLQEILSENNFETPVTIPKKRGRKKKSVSGETNEKDEDLNISQGSSKKGRKRKEINYAALEDGNDLNEESTERVVKKRGRKKKVFHDGDDADDNLDQTFEGMLHDQDDDDIEDDDDYPTNKLSRKTPSKIKKNIKCHHCDYCGKTAKGITRHYAVSHQLWWTAENPEGIFDKSCLQKVFNLKKFLNCTKCNKQINVVTYYANHFEWCGREHLTYTCEHCERQNLMLRWQHLHLKSCPALIAEAAAEMREKDNEMLAETADTGSGKKRNAAKKAMSMVHAISKEMEPSAYSDQSDNDPDVVLDEEEEDDDDDDDEHDDDINEEDVETPDDDDDDNDDVLADEHDTGVNPFWQRALCFNPNSLMEKFVKENWSEQLFQDWLPWKQDWKQLSQKESEPYLPKTKTSVRFCFRSAETPSSLQTLQSTIMHKFPMFYTGLVVWDIAWCPTNLHCTDSQFLAVTGKTDHSQDFHSDERLDGPGLIQIWDTGIKNNKLISKAMPKLSFNMVHDYGLATKMVWCPSGCYKTNENQTEADSYTRLGLLAVCFTDGTCKIFSVPLFPATEEEEPQTYKARPVLTLVPYNEHEGGNYTCSAMDWIKSKGHTKVILGYSSGAVKLYNLLTKSPLQRITTNNEVRLLPYLNLQPHGRLVRAVQFCSLFENIIVTSSEDFETVFHDLTNLGAPIHCDSGNYMATCMSSSIWQHGVYTGSDENYAVLANKARYIDSGHLLFVAQHGHRKDDRGAYYVSSQPACIWDIQCSDWIGFLASCDNRGNISGLMLKDYLKITPDCKSYKQRQILLKTVIKEDSAIKENNGSDDNSTCVDQSEHCTKCASIQSDETLHNDKSENDQSETKAQCSCKKLDQSESGTELSNENGQDIKKECIERVNEGATREENGKIDKTWQNHEKLEKNSILKFEENFKVPKFCPNDKNSDRYDRPSIAAIKTVSFNPNNQQCCWLAYGGNSGLVRLVNIQKLLDKKVLADIRKKNQI